VVFESGDVWDYQMTDFEEVEEYMGYLTKENLYGSVGAYYHREIKGNFESNKVDVPFDDPTWMAEEDEFFSEIESIEEEEEQRDATRTVQQLDTLVKFRADKVIRELKDVIKNSIYESHEFSSNEEKYIDIVITEYIAGLDE